DPAQELRSRAPVVEEISTERVREGGTVSERVPDARGECLKVNHPAIPQHPFNISPWNLVLLPKSVRNLRQCTETQVFELESSFNLLFVLGQVGGRVNHSSLPIGNVGFEE